MSIEFALDELYATGWTALDTAGCERSGDGRWFPRSETVRREFEAAGFTLAVTHIQLFDCFRAQWADEQGNPAGEVVGQTAEEAAIYALSHLRRAVAASP